MSEEKYNDWVMSHIDTLYEGFTDKNSEMFEEYCQDRFEVACQSDFVDEDMLYEQARDDRMIDEKVLL